MIHIDEEEQHDDKTEFQLMAEQAGPTDQVKLETRPDSDEKPIAEVNPDEEEKADSPKIEPEQAEEKQPE